jgi:hypothetical protein
MIKTILFLILAHSASLQPAAPTISAAVIDTPTIHRVVGPEGKKRLILWSGLYPARMAVSEDDGATWSRRHLRDDDVRALDGGRASVYSERAPEAVGVG